MEVNVNTEKKFVLIWLNRAEARDDVLRESLKPMFVEYKSNKLRPVLMVSGEHNLAECTRDLLKHNNELWARNHDGTTS